MASNVLPVTKCSRSTLFPPPANRISTPAILSNPALIIRNTTEHWAFCVVDHYGPKRHSSDQVSRATFFLPPAHRISTPAILSNPAMMLRNPTEHWAFCVVEHYGRKPHSCYQVFHLNFLFSHLPIESAPLRFFLTLP